MAMAAKRATTNRVGDCHASQCIELDSVKDCPSLSVSGLQWLMTIINDLDDPSSNIFGARTSPSPTRLYPAESRSNSPNRSSLTSFLSLSSSSSETACPTSDDGSESDTDFEEDQDHWEAEMKREGKYSYRLLPALTVPSFIPGPSKMDAPWPYTFEKGDKAFAKGGNGTWRRVTILDNGVVSSLPTFEEDAPEAAALVYSAQWVDASGQTFRATFCPTRGDLKPDDAHVRRLLVRDVVLLP